MRKGVLLALGIILVLTLVPIVNVIGIPFGPFIGAYYGISTLGVNPDPSIKAAAVRAAVFGSLLGLLMLLILVAVAASLMATIDLSQRFTWLLWLTVAVFTMYTATMAVLGAMYSQLRAAR